MSLPVNMTVSVPESTLKFATARSIALAMTLDEFINSLILNHKSIVESIAAKSTAFDRQESLSDPAKSL